MHQVRSIRVLLTGAAATASIWVMCAALAAGTGSPMQEPPQESDPPSDGPSASEPDRSPEHDSERVILRVNRNLSVHGHVQLEDADVIVVRTPHGEVHSFPKVRVLQIVRLVDPEPGQRGVVLLNNGQQREGIVIEDTFEHVLIEIEGIPAKLRREFVDYVVLEPTFEQRYEQFRSSVQPGMVEQHIALCRWLIRERRYDLAHENLLEILSHQNHAEARRLLHMVNAQLALQASPAQPSTPDEDAPTEAVDKYLPPPLLDRDQVNLIRVYEIDFDYPPQLFVAPETVQKLFERYGTHESVPATQSERNALLRGDSERIVRLMFELRARELYPEIKVNTEPQSLNMFRLRVHNAWLLNKCATSGCHGGSEAGDLYLHRRNYTDERVRYTNFMILERFDTKSQWPLINYEDPEMSLLIQYGLPRDNARLPHPEVKGWEPVFVRNDAMLRDSISWIQSMMQPRPEYPIDFDPRPRLNEAYEEAESDGDDEPDQSAP